MIARLNSLQSESCRVTINTGASCRSVSTDSPILDVADLKRRLIATLSGLQQHVIDEAIDQPHKRLHACLGTVWRHYEHLR